MKHLQFISLFAVAALLLIGCRAPSSAVSSEGGQSDSTKVYGSAIHVLVDGRDSGTVPRTLRIRRSFGTREITIWQAGKALRTFELPIQPTTEGQQTRMGFWGNMTSDGETYDARSLPHKDEIYQIPFSRGPMKIEDHQYGLTLLINE